MSLPPNDAARRADPALLRRVDWRFLAGRARFERAVCDARPDLEAALPAICDEIVERDSGKSCSVGVLSNPNLRTLRRVRSQLDPDAVCYIEWDRPGSLRRRQHMLERAGFAQHESYAMWPRPRRTNPLFWLPVSRSPAVEYFLATRPLPRETVPRLIARVTRRLWRIARRLGWLAPLAVLASNADETPAPSLAPTLLESWERWGLGAIPDSLACLLLTGGRSTLNKIVVLVFADDEPAPRLAVKLARTPASVAGLQREAASLRAVAHTSVPEVADVPRFLFAEPLLGTFAIGESIVGGRPVQLDLTRAGYRDVVVRVTDALRALVPQVDPSPVQDWWPRLGAPVFAAFRERFGGMVDASRIDVLETRMRALAPLPIVPEQRDCSPWNVLVTTEGRVALLDWESAEPNGLPGLDLLYFLANAAFVVDGTLGSPQESATYDALLDERTANGCVYHEMLRRYAAGLALDADTYDALRPFMWMVHAIGEYDRELASMPPETADGGRAAARRSHFLARWQQDVKDATAI